MKLTDLTTPAILTEMIWEDRYEAARRARRYPRGWIHFTDVPKLGVHPTKEHHDPPGIYFYPVRWLFTEAPSLSQFATERKYFFIVQFKKTANIINLGKLRWTKPPPSPRPTVGLTRCKK